LLLIGKSICIFVAKTYGMEKREQSILKNGICILLLVIGINSLINFVYSYLNNLLFGEYVNFILFAAHVFGLWVVRKNSYDELKNMMPFYMIVMIIILFPEMIVSFKKEQLTGLLWLIPAAPLGLTIFFPNRTGALWSIIVFIFVTLTYFLQPFIPELLFTKFMLPAEQQKTTDFFTIWNVFSCSIVPLYTKFKLASLKTESAMDSGKTEDTDKKADDDKSIKEKDMEKFNNLYNEIVKCFEEKKLYRDAELTVSKLADMLNTNSNYIYQAIQQNKQMNFNTFVNMYRINMIKSMIAAGWDKKYTIQHIYTSAGFKHQTTFNKVFKSIEGMSPSDYIALQKV